MKYRYICNLFFSFYCSFYLLEVLCVDNVSNDSINLHCALGEGELHVVEKPANFSAKKVQCTVCVCWFLYFYNLKIPSLHQPGVGEGDELRDGDGVLPQLQVKPVISKCHLANRGLVPLHCGRSLQSVTSSRLTVWTLQKASSQLASSKVMKVVVRLKRGNICTYTLKLVKQNMWL